MGPVILQFIMKSSLVFGLSLLGAAHAISTISAYGNKFFYKDGSRKPPPIYSLTPDEQFG